MSALVVEATDARWRALAAGSEATVFHSPPWHRLLAGHYGFEPRVQLIVDQRDRPLAAMLFCRIADPIGRRTVCLPFSDFCDPLGAVDDLWTELCTALVARAEPVHLRFLRFAPFERPEGLEVVKRARWHAIDLNRDEEEIRARFTPERRRAIHKAERAAVAIEPATDEAFLDEFFALHLGVRKNKYRLLAQPRGFFAAMRRSFLASGGWHPLAARLGGRTIAATVYLEWDGVLYYKFNASRPDGLAVRPNDLLLWEGIRLGKRLGCRLLDLGASDDDQPGLIRFKRSFGAREGEIRHLCWVPNGWPVERERAVRGTFGALSALLTDPGVPDRITAAAGDVLYRYFA